MEELMLSKDINIITAEINSYKQIAGQAIFEIGKRLKYVKENDLAHGEFTEWCETNLNFSYRQANRYLKAYERFSNMTLGAEMSLKKLDLLSSLDDEQLETPIETSSGEVKKPTEMTQREIEEYKKALKQAEEDKKRLGQLLTEERNKPQKVIEIEKVIKDEKELNDYKNKLKVIEQEKSKLEAELKKNNLYADQFKKLKSDIEKLADEKEDVIKQIDNASTIGKFIARVERSFEEDLAPIKYTNAIQYSKDSQAVMEALDKILTRVENWCEEIRSEMPKNNYIDVEVLEYE